MTHSHCRGQSSSAAADGMRDAWAVIALDLPKFGPGYVWLTVSRRGPEDVIERYRRSATPEGVTVTEPSAAVNASAWYPVRGVSSDTCAPTIAAAAGSLTRRWSVAVVCAHVLSDDEGNPLLEPADAKWLENRNGTTLERIFAAWQALSQEAQQDAEKN